MNIFKINGVPFITFSAEGDIEATRSDLGSRPPYKLETLDQIKSLLADVLMDKIKGLEETTKNELITELRKMFREKRDKEKQENGN